MSESNSLRILMVFPGIINELPPLITCSLAAASQGNIVAIVAAGIRNEARQCLEQGGVSIRSFEAINYPRSFLGKLGLRVRFLGILIRTIRSFSPDVCWYHGAYGMAYRSVVTLLLGRRRHLIVAHAHELHDTDPKRFRTQNKTLRAADMAICPEPFRAQILRAVSSSKVPIFVVPNRNATPLSADVPRRLVTDMFRDVGGQSACNRFVVYQGLVAPERCVAELIIAFKSVCATDVGLIVMGPSTDPVYMSRIQALAASDTRVVFFDPIPAPAHLEVTKQCTWGVVLYAPTSLNTLFCAPNKVYEYAQFGMGMILPAYPGMSRLVEKFQLGALVNPEDPMSIANAIGEMIASDSAIYRARCEAFLQSEPDPMEEYKKILRRLKDMLAGGTGEA